MAELERQARNDERCEEDRQKTLAGTSEGDYLTFDSVKVLASAGVSTTANLQGMTSGFDWHLNRVTHFERSATLTVNHDVVCASSDFNSDCLMRQSQHCGHR